MSHHEAHAPSRDEIIKLIQKPLPARLSTICLALAILGFAIFFIGLALAPDRAWRAFQINWMFFTTVSSSAVSIAAVQRITTARWSRPVVRLLEGFVAWLPIAFVLLVITLIAGLKHIFPWAVTPPTVPEKALWLAPGFFMPRVIVLFGVITVLSVAFVRASVRLDVGLIPEFGASWAKGIRASMRRGFGDERRELHSTHTRLGHLAVWLSLAFGFFWTVLSWDLSMSVDYHFQSTMYGWQIFMGGWVVAFMVLALMVPAWRKHLGAHEIITDEHTHDVGKLCFAFTAFWGYLTFSQLLVIWYGNMGEETHFFRNRLTGPYTALTVTVGVLMFGVPFFSLLSRSVKSYAPLMSIIALCSILGLWLHRYLEIYPPLYADATQLPLGIWEIGMLLGFLGLWGWSYTAFMNAFPVMRVAFLTSPHRDEVQVPVDPKTMETLPAHE